MKKYSVALIILLSTLLSCLPATAKDPGIIIDGTTALKNKAFIINDRTYVPMRELFEYIGAAVSWNDSTKSAIATLNNDTISFKIDSNIVVKNGENFWSDSQCKLIDEKTYVPIRIILELLSFRVNWNETEQNVEIVSPPSKQPENDDIDKPAQTFPEEDTFHNEFEIKVLELINIERSKNGLTELVLDKNLSSVARKHSEDMYKRNFFSHTNPDGMSPFDRMKNFGISYMYAGENIAAGQSSPEEVVNAWMNSQGHRANILNSNFNKIGIGYFNSGASYVHYWTQCFTN